MSVNMTGRRRRGAIGAAVQIVHKKNNNKLITQHGETKLKKFKKVLKKFYKNLKQF